MHIISLLGAPGSGKGSLGTCLAEQNAIYHFSVGDVLRDRRTKGCYDGLDKVLQNLNQGELLETEFIVSLVIDISKEYELKGARTLFIDGFPRRLDQALEFESRYQKFDLLICLVCPTELAKERYLDRKLPQRAQDNVQLFEKRVAEYDRENMEIKEYYAGIAKWLEIPSDKAIEETFPILLSMVAKFGFL